MIRDKVFSEYEVKETSIKFKNDSEATKVGCVGSLEETLDSLVVTKKCEGVVTKKRPRGTGTGSLKITGHMKYDAFNRAYGMLFTDKLKEGVYGYGSESIHEGFSLVCKVKDEDNNVKLKAYPNCIIESGISRKVENGGEEVAEIEMEVSIMPDDYGFGMYEALIEDIKDKDLETSWMENFNSDDVQKTEIDDNSENNNSDDNTDEI